MITSPEIIEFLTVIGVSLGITALVWLAFSTGYRQAMMEFTHMMKKGE